MPQRTNVIWFFTDQQRAQSMGHEGDRNVCTPHLDRFAAEGVRASGVSGFPLCCPYRGSLLSGVYPHQCVPGHEHRLPETQKTIAHAFSEHGYDTAYYGKWHLDGFHERDGRAGLHVIPRERRGGFGTWIGYENNNSPFDCWVHGHRGNEDVPLHRLDGFETDALTDLLIADLESRARDPNARPFFAAVSVQPPHDPYVAPAEWMQRHTPGRVQLRPNVPPVAAIEEQARRNLAGYHASIENIDHNFGRLRDALRRTGIWEHTHVVFFSDHGDNHGSHGQFAKMSPWEESIRVPMLIGGGVPYYGTRRAFSADAGRATALINHVDMAPTALGLAGLPRAEWMQGRDYSGLLRSDRPAPDLADSAYLQCVIPTGHGNSVDRPWRGIVTLDGWKYVCLEQQPWLMFDLNSDPYELANLAHNTRYRVQRSRLHQRLRQWIADTADTFALPQL